LWFVAGIRTAKSTTSVSLFLLPGIILLGSMLIFIRAKKINYDPVVDLSNEEWGEID